MIAEHNMIEDKLSLKRGSGSSQIKLDIVSATLRQITNANEIPPSTSLSAAPNLGPMYEKRSNTKQKSHPTKRHSGCYIYGSFSHW